MAELGRIPRPGDQVDCDGWEFTVVSLDRRRVRMIEARRTGSGESHT
jgi:CBS domain containing-hemolysin-like protein